MQPLRIALVCRTLSWAGGLIRFIRFGREIKKYGYQLSFIVLSENKDWQLPINNEFEIHSFQQALNLNWEVTMIPGAGFPDALVEQFKHLRHKNFGLRIQHILNDQTRRNRFLRINQCFRPNIVVFNNRSWLPGSYTEFSSNSFHFLEGAVSCSRSSTEPLRSRPTPTQNLVVGGLANKNPEPLLDAIQSYEWPVSAKLYGRSENLESQYQDLVRDGRLELLGNISYDKLEAYYQSIDCIVHTEKFAGWANLAAEALAYKIPLICTSHGTLSFAIDKVTALVLPEPTPKEIAIRLRCIHENKDDIVNDMRHNGRAIISRYTWFDYTKKLLAIIESGPQRYYTYAPHLGLYGKWPLESRIKGLKILIDIASNMTILDLGASECIVAKTFLDAGAFCVHCFDYNPDYIVNGLRLIQDYQTSYAIEADISPWQEFKTKHCDLLLNSYDIVLFLGVYHHLPSTTRLDVLVGAASFARKYFAIRTPIANYLNDHIDEVLKRHGLKLTNLCEDDAGIGMGSLYLYERVH